MKLVILEAKCLEAKVITPFGAKCSYGLPETIGKWSITMHNFE